MESKNVKINGELHQKLKIIAINEGKTLEIIVNGILQNYIKKSVKEGKI